MRYQCFRTSNVCDDFVKEVNFEMPHSKERIIPASKRFFWAVQQYIAYEMDTEIKKLPFLKRIKEKIREYYEPEILNEEYEEKIIHKREIITDYDEFRPKVKSLLESNDNEKQKEGGKLAEQYLTQFAVYKTFLKDLNEEEYYPFYFVRQNNQKYFPSTFTEQEFKIALAEDFGDEREIHEFKATASSDQNYIQNRIKAAYCQACFYSFLDYYTLNMIYKFLRYVRPYKIIIELYQVKSNKILSYEFKLNYKKFKPDYGIIEKLCEYYHNKSGIDILNLIKQGEFEQDDD